MAFKQSISASFFYPVTFTTIREDGSQAKHQILFRFKRMDADELSERVKADGGQLWSDLMTAHDGDAVLVNQKFTAELLRRGKGSMTSSEMADDLMDILCDWKDGEVTDDQGPVEFSRENLLNLVKFVPGLYAAIKASFNEANSGEGKRKN